MPISFPVIRAGFLLLAFCGLALGSCSDSGNTVLGPRDSDFKVESIEPYAARPGAKVKLRGYGFGRDPEHIRVTVGGARVDSLLWLRTDVMEFLVPENASGGGIIIEKIVPGSATAIGYGFGVLTSPYAYSSFSVSLTGVTGKRTWDTSRSSGVSRGGTDTAEVAFGASGKIGNSGDGACLEVTRGDTVRICAHSRSQQGRHNQIFDHDDERQTFYAIADPVRKVLKKVEISRLLVQTSQQTTLESWMNRRGTVLLLDELPYTIDADGALVVEVTGSALRDKIVAYKASSQETSHWPAGWFNSSEAINELITFPEDAELTIRLYD